MVSYTCEFSEPRLYDGGIPTNAGQQWQFYKETCTYNSSMYAPTTTIASSTDIQLYASFTAGEIFMSLLMFILIVIELVKMLACAFSSINTKKTFLAYSGGDVEVRKDL
jgi:hypothetical protein